VKNAVVIVAAGRGGRFVDLLPKQFLSFAGRPLLDYSLDFFLHLPDIDHVCVVVPKGLPLPEDIQSLLDAYRAEGLTVVEGGTRRQDSVMAGLRALRPAPEIVLIHDAARPFPPKAAVLESIDKARETGGAILAIPCTDTVKEVSSPAEPILRTLDRSRLWFTQTPQTFRFDDVMAALEDIEAKGLDITDEAQAFEVTGRPVFVVESSASNIKITTPEDLALAECLLDASQRR